MMLRPLITCVLAAMGAASASALKAETLPSPYGAWLVEEVAGEAVADPVRQTLRLSQDGTASGSSGCNRFFSDVDSSEEASLRFGALGSTRMLCADEVMAEEQRYLAALETVRSWHGDGVTLVLADESGDIAVRLVSDTDGATISIPVPGADAVQSQSRSYDCEDGRTVEVDYINAGSVSLAVLTMQDEFVVAANVIAASGARYAGGPYVWWSRGSDEALLEDIRQGEDSSPMTCSAP
jgi:heat shock protein HslJ